MTKNFYEQENKGEIVGVNVQNDQFKTYHIYLLPFQDATNRIVSNKLIDDYMYKFPDYATETYPDTRSQIESTK